jgi:uncharacterized oxidoreductase
MPRFSPEQLLEFSRRILAALGSPAAHADAVAAHLAGANLAGHDSHGVLRLLQYAKEVESGNVDPRAEPRVVQDRPGTALLDGNRAWGQIAAGRATELAIDKARSHGVAAVSARRCPHIGRVGVYPLLAARAGFVAQVWCNGHGVARVAPWGGAEPRLATNPIALAVPRRGEPILVDVTTSVVAEGKVRVAKLAGKAVPDGWILDREGRSTTRPEDLYAGGTILPLGGREGHKGYGLAVMADLFGGLVGGSGAGLMTDHIGNGLFIAVADPAAFDEREAFLDRVEAYAAYLKASKRREGVEEILLPGEPELRTEAKRRREGIEIDDGTRTQLAELARRLGAPVL